MWSFALELTGRRTRRDADGVGRRAYTALAGYVRGIALVGLVDALLVLGAIVVVQQIEGHLLYPILLARTVHLHPAVIVVALAAGGALGGIVGVFLAVPTAGLLSVISRVQPPPAGARLAVARRRRRHG